eukprot:g9662.t1
MSTSASVSSQGEAKLPGLGKLLVGFGGPQASIQAVTPVLILGDQKCLASLADKQLRLAIVQSKDDQQERYDETKAARTTEVTLCVCPINIHLFLY